MRSFSGISASLVLAALTLIVFAKSELRGPEGAINRYFIALLNRDQAGAESAVFGTREDFIGGPVVSQHGDRIEIDAEPRAGSGGDGATESGVACEV